MGWSREDRFNVVQVVSMGGSEKMRVLARVNSDSVIPEISYRS